MADAPDATPPAAEAPVETSKRRFTAKLRHARISPRKMRYVVDLIRGKNYNNAISILRVCPKRGAMFCKKLIQGSFAKINSSSCSARASDVAPR